MKKNFILPMTMIGLILGVAGCGPTASSELPLESVKLEEKVVPFTNLSTFIPLTKTEAKLYFKEGSILPLITMDEFLSCLDGFIKSDIVDKKILNNTAKYYYYSNDKLYTMEFDAKNETIKQNSALFFSVYGTTESDLYELHHDAGLMVDVKGSRDSEVLYDLKPYNYDIIIQDNEVYVPYEILNMIGINQGESHLIYNQKELYFLNSYLADDETIYQISNKELHGTVIPDEMIEARYNQFCFMLDKMYGLRTVFNGKTADEFIKEDKEIYNKLHSKNNNVYERGLIDFLLKKLDDPHTSLGYRNFYSEITTKKDIKIPKKFPSDYGSRYVDIINSLRALSKQYQALNIPNNIANSYGHTGFIKFDSFDLETKDYLYDEDGNPKPHAHLHDSFLYVKRGIEILTKDPKIRNIVLDLSCNTGGYIDMAIAIMGLLTNDDIDQPYHNMINDQQYYNSYRVDADLDGDYNDDDAFTGFNYYILTSPASFSSSLSLSGMAHDMGVAKIIGQKSGGGMCSVGSIMLVDGTSFKFSSNFTSPGMKSSENGDKELYINEYGLEPDIEIPTEKFYDFKFIDELLTK